MTISRAARSVKTDRGDGKGYQPLINSGSDPALLPVRVLVRPADAATVCEHALAGGASFGVTAGGANPLPTDNALASRHRRGSSEARPREFLQTQYSRNYWSYEPAASGCSWTSLARGVAFNTIARCLELLPGTRGAFMLGSASAASSRSASSTAPGSATWRSTWALEIPAEMRYTSLAGKRRSAGASGQYNVIYGCAEELRGQGGRSSGRPNGRQPGRARFDFAGELERLIPCWRNGDSCEPSDAGILDEAASRDIPFIHL